LNDVPVANNDSYTVNEDTTLTVPAAGVLANDSDVDGDPLRTVLVSNPASGTLNLSTNGGFTYTPSLNFTGVVTFTYRAADYGLTSSVATVTITVLPLNDVPVANNDSYTVNEDTTLTIPAAGVLANDSDVDGDVLSAVLVSNPATGSLSLNTNGAFTYTPSLHFTGTVTFTYRAADHGLTSAVATVTITVLPLNDAPVASNDTYTVSEDATLVVPPGGVLTNDFDVDGDALTAVLLTNVQHGTLSLGTNGAFTYTPSLNYTGADTFAYVATDGSLTSGVAIVSILVTALNDGPVALNDAYSVNEDTTLTIPAPGVLGNDVDVDGDLLASVLVSGVSHGTLNLSTNGAFTYTPSLNYTGVDVFTYVATDGLLTSVVATVSITVVPVNDPPTTGGARDSYTVLEDATLTVPSAGVLANDADVDGDSLSAVLVSTTANGLLVLNANGSFTYTPAPNFFGADSFTYRASDGQTGSAPATVSITVLPVNDAPAFAGGGDQKVNQNAPAQTVAWASSISVGPANEAGQTAAFELTNDNGSLFSVQPGIAPNGTLTYTPAPNAFGTATIRVKLRDNGGTANGGANVSAETVFHIVVNSPPTISIVAPTPGAALLFPATFSVISSVNDPDGTVTNVQFLLNGTNLLRVAEAPFYFVMTNAMPGNYQFRAIATDNCGLSATSALVSIDVITNTVVATGPIVLNLQNGLFEQFVTISNRTSTAWPNGVRLAILNLDATNRVWNPTGTNNGAPYIDKIVSIPPGGSTIITVQYYVPNPRTIPNPTLVATPRPFTVPTTVPVLSRITRTEGGVNLHFPTQSGRFYFLQGTENFAQWTTLPAAIAGTGGVVVVPQPAAQAHLFYRLLLVP
jgi:VCBS repeat-containing protein